MTKKVLSGIGLIIVVVLAYLVGFLVAYYRGTLPYRATSRIVRLVVHYRPQDDPGWSQRTRIFAGAKDVGDLTMFGDSLSNYGDWGLLLPNVRVSNRGIPGDTTQGGLQRLRSGEPTAKIVAVMLGTNDPSAGISLAETKENIGQIVKILHARGTHVILQSTLLSGYASKNARIRSLNQFEQRLCSDGSCVFVDISKELSNGTVLTPAVDLDHTHINADGYRLWAGTLLRSLRP